MGLFKKTRPDKNKINTFCDWFVENNESIIASVENKEIDSNRMYKILDEVEMRLSIVYREGYKGNIEFDYGFNGKKWDFNLYHMNVNFLIEATSQIADELNNRIGDKWIINTSK